MIARWMPNEMCGRSRSSRIAFAAAGHGTIRVQELAMPFSIDSTTAAFTASCMPKSSQLTISIRASGAKPSSSLDSRSTTASLPDQSATEGTHDACPNPSRLGGHCGTLAQSFVLTPDGATDPQWPLLQALGLRPLSRHHCHMAMTKQPSGTVTLVFTDIEGSTRLLDKLGPEGYRSALGEHQRVVRDTFGQHGGFEVDTAGDGFFYAFSTAAGAATAVGEALAALDGGPIRIRAGIHTGEPIVEAPKYVGLDVHRAARIMAAAHGGQALLSRTTRDLLGASFAVRDLGEHRLKDLSAPQRLFQLGTGDFPRPRTLHLTNLPVPATDFLGRDRELGDVVE